jgi:hypothetical protein
MRKPKTVTRRQEIRELREKIRNLKDAHRTLLRKDARPLMKRLAVLECAEKLGRAERALVKEIEGDKANPQLELLSLDAPAEASATAPEIAAPAQASMLPGSN